MTVGLAIAFIAPAAWLYLLCARGGFWRAEVLDDAACPIPPVWPEIAVIIPARNETDTLPGTLPSLLRNDYPGGLRVVLVDDRSEDGTGSAAANCAAALGASERLQVVAAGDLPAGWKGKVRAMQTGLEQVAAFGTPPRYILFTDADIAYDAQALTRLVARAEAKALVLASHMVRLRCQSLAERFLIPAFVFFFQMLFPFAWVGDPSRKNAAAAGGCMLARYDALMEAGGLHPIRSALIDDCALGRLMKPRGPVSLSLTSQVHSVRAYPGFGDIRAMVARTAYDQLGYSVPALIAATLGMAAIYVAPPLLALFATGAVQFSGLAGWLFMAVAFYPILKFYGRSPWQCLTLPLIALCYMGFTLDSAWQYWRHRGGVWKGRVQTPRAQAA